MQKSTLAFRASVGVLLGEKHDDDDDDSWFTTPKGQPRGERKWRVGPRVGIQAFSHLGWVLAKFRRG